MASSNPSQSQTYRDYEQQLDDHYKTYPLSKACAEEAVYSLLAAFDSFHIIDAIEPVDPSDVGDVQSRKGLDEGFTQAIRWLCRPRNLDLAPVSDRQLIGSAGDFLLYSSSYVDIADFHKMHERGQVTFKVDEKSKTVKFYTDPSTSSIGPLLGFIEDTHDASRRAERIRQALSDDAEKLASLRKISALSNFFRSDGRICLTNIEILNSPRYKEAFNILRAGYSDDPFLPEQADLDGFTLKGFDAYWDALWRWSIVVLNVYLTSVLDEERDQETTMPTQVVCRGKFLKQIAVLSGLDQQKLLAITERLTLDDRTKGGPDIYQQPLICGKELVSWSPRLVLRSKPRRNMLRLMARTDRHKNVADTLIGSREIPMLNHFAAYFAQNGYCTKIDTKLKSGNDIKGQIDLLIYNPAVPSEVMVIEAKAFLGVDEINEVAYATDEMIKKAQRQVVCAIDFLKSASIADKKKIFDFVDWNQVSRYYGLVVTPGTEPNEKYDHSVIPAMSLHSIKERISLENLQSPQSIWDQSSKKPWLAALVERKATYKTVKVGKTTYLLPCIKADNTASTASPQI